MDQSHCLSLSFQNYPSIYLIFFHLLRFCNLLLISITTVLHSVKSNLQFISQFSTCICFLNLTLQHVQLSILSHVLFCTSSDEYIFVYTLTFTLPMVYVFPVLLNSLSSHSQLKGQIHYQEWFLVTKSIEEYYVVTRAEPFGLRSKHQR